MEAGYDVIRIREHPLEKLFDTDITFTNPFKAKQIVDRILLKMIDSYEVRKEQVDLIKVYIKSNTIRNSIELNRYINHTLKRKAEIKPKHT